MKLKLLMTGLLGLIAAPVFAQKGELSNAKDKYEKYAVEKNSKFTMTQAVSDIQDAKTSIDKAALNEKTANLPLTFALKGAIYSSLTLNDTVPATSLPNFKIADDALAKAKVLDSVKHENKAMIDAAYLNLAQYEFNMGRSEYQNKKYDLAYQSFDYYRSVLPEDTSAIYVTGLAAANQGNSDPKYYTYAINNYNKLLTTKYSGNPRIYLDLSTIYLNKKDTADAFKISGEGVAKFPTNSDLRSREIQIGLQTGKQDILVSKIADAIAADPKNKELYYYDGLTYSQISDNYAVKAKATKVAADKAAFHQKRAENDQKAADALKSAVGIDPNYFDATLTLGYVLLNPALDEYNAANQLPTSKQKEYEAAMAKSKADLEVAKPYLLKAVEINPNSTDALTNLKAYYLVQQDMVNANKIQKQIEALPTNKN